MLNAESRKYFDRAIVISFSAFNAYELSATNHLSIVQECAKIYDRDNLVEYLQTSNVSTLVQCAPFDKNEPFLLTWTPTIESVNTTESFLVEKPENIYNSNEAPSIDTMFGFMSTV